MLTDRESGPRQESDNLTKADVQSKSQATTAAVTCEGQSIRADRVRGWDQKSNSTVMTREHKKCELERRPERSFKGACCQALAKEMSHDLDVNFNDNREGIAEPRHEYSGHVGECS